MRIDDLRQAKDRRPFKPFLIRTADGREVEVKHPDAIAWEPVEFPRTLICIQPGGRWELIDVGLVASLGMEAPAEAMGEKGS